MFTLFWLLIITGSIIFYREHLPEDIKDSNAIRKDLKPKHFLIGTLSIISVLATGTLLIRYIPGMQFGWLTWIASQASETQTGQTVESSPFLWATTIILILIFSIVLPKFAFLEEEKFRKPYVWATKPMQFMQALKFGIAHLIMGIPIGAALALSVGGVFFTETATRAAKKELNTALIEISQHHSHDETIAHADKSIQDAETQGIWQSTLVHTAHNYIAMSLCLLLSLMLIFVSN